MFRVYLSLSLSLSSASVCAVYRLSLLLCLCVLVCVCVPCAQRARNKMAADSGMETCPSPEIADSRKRPLDCDAENGATKRSHYGSGMSDQEGVVATSVFDDLASSLAPWLPFARTRTRSFGVSRAVASSLACTHTRATLAQ